MAGGVKVLECLYHPTTWKRKEIRGGRGRSYRPPTPCRGCTDTRFQYSCGGGLSPPSSFKNPLSFLCVRALESDGGGKREKTFGSAKSWKKMRPLRSLSSRTPKGAGFLDPSTTGSPFYPLLLQSPSRSFLFFALYFLGLLYFFTLSGRHLWRMLCPNKEYTSPMLFSNVNIWKTTLG